MSVRSSTDEVINNFSPKKTESSLSINGNSNQINDLDFFFDIISSPDKSKINESNSLESDHDFTIIKPLKDEKLIKLKSSVDSLRRELQVETKKNEKETQNFKNQINITEVKRRHDAAIKIQKWYRKNLSYQVDKQKQLETMFNQKKIEMKKKFEKELIRSSTNFNHHNKQIKTNKSIDPSKLKHNVSKPRPIENINRTPRIESPKLDLSKPIEKLNLEKLDLDFENSINVKEKPIQLISNQNINTVESLLTTLEKIDRETSSLLAQPNGKFILL